MNREMAGIDDMLGTDKGEADKKKADKGEAGKERSCS